MSATTSHVAMRDVPLADGIWSRSYRSLSAGLLLTVLAVAFEQLSVAATMPATVRDLGDLPLYGWVFSGFMLAMIVGLTIGGGEVDRQGPLRPFIAGATLFGVGLLLAGLAPSMFVLIAGRTVQGLGAGFITSVIYGAIGRAYPEASRPRMLALLSSAYTLPSLMGPALAALIADSFGWRWVFLGLAPAVPLAALLVAPPMRDLHRAAGGSRDWKRIGAALRLAAGVGLLTAGLANHQVVLLAVVLAGAGVALAVSAARALLPAGAGRSAGLAAALLTAALLNMAFFGVDVFVPLALTELRGQATVFSGLALTAAAIGWVVSAWLQAHLVRRHSRRLLVGAGLALVFAGTGGIIAVLQPATPVWLALVAWGMAGLGMGLASPTLTLLSMELGPANQEGASTAAMTLAGILGVALGTGIGGVVVGSTEAAAAISSTSVVTHAGLMAGLLIAAVWVATRLPGRPQATERQ